MTVKAENSRQKWYWVAGGAQSVWRHPCTYWLTLEVRGNELESFLKFIWSLWPVTFNCQNYVQGLYSITKPYFGLEIKNSWVDNLTFQLFHHWNTSRKMIKSKYFIFKIKEIYSNLEVPQAPTLLSKVLFSNKIYSGSFEIEKLELVGTGFMVLPSETFSVSPFTKLDYDLWT